MPKSNHGSDPKRSYTQLWVGSQLVPYGISWEMYEKLLEVFAATPRMTYYKGTLELMTPLPEHETYSWTLSRLVALSEELGLEIRGLKSTTWRSQPRQLVRKQTSVSTSKRSRSSR